MLYYLVLIVVKPFFKIFFPTTIEGIDNVPKEETSMIVVANHINDFDPFRVTLFFPFKVPIHWFAKKELYSVKESFNDFSSTIKNPFMRLCFSILTVFVIRNSKTIPVNRTNTSSRINRYAIKSAKELLINNKAIGVFGEGGTRRSGEVRPIFASLAKKTGANILPVKIEKKRIVFGKPIIHDSDSIKNTETFAREIMQVIYNM